jgi:hypothetical protein
MRIPKPLELAMILRSGALAALVPVMVRALPLPRVLSMLRPEGKVREAPLSPGRLVQIADAAVRIGPHFGVGECLLRSLVLYNLLCRAAYKPILVIGGRLCEGQLDCHCWIELDGNSLCEFNDPRERFKLLYTFV